MKATFIPDTFSSRFRIEGQCEDAGWARQHAARYTAEPYCEVSVSRDGNQLTSYGGTVWPGAWPSLFDPIPATAQYGSGGFRITAAGKALLLTVAPAWSSVALAGPS